MQIQASTVTEYMSLIPEERREAINQLNGKPLQTTCQKTSWKP
ncbi:MAG: hypothetical protein R2795_16365 [Saprospiraceae bacterium]